MINEFYPEDICKMTIIPEVNGVIDEILDRFALYKELGPAYTYWVDDEPLWCGGIIMLWRGVGEAWGVPSMNLYNYGFRFMRQFVRIWHNLINDMGLRRVQTSVLLEYQASRRMLEWLGFKNEGLMSRYGPDGKDYYRMAYLVE